MFGNSQLVESSKKQKNEGVVSGLKYAFCEFSVFLWVILNKKAKEDNEQIVEENMVFCYCQKPYTEGEFMICIFLIYLSLTWVIYCDL